MTINDNSYNIKATITASLDFKKYEEKIEIKNFIYKEIKKRRVKLESIKFNINSVKVIVSLKSEYRLKDIELYIFAHLFFLQMDKKLPRGIKINENSVFTEYIV